MNKMLVNQKTFNLKSTITDDWGNRHRVAIDLEAKSTAENWKMEFSLPNDYEIKEIYGAELIEEGGKTYLSGANWNKSLDSGDKTEIVLIVDEGNSRNQNPIKPTFVFADSTNSDSMNYKLDTSSLIAEDWDGGYKIELDITAQSKAQAWTLDFELPYEISESYGVDLINNGDGSYTINGQNDQVDLNKGQSIKPIFIVQDNGKQAIVPSFDDSVSVSEGKIPPTVNNTNNNYAPVNIPEGNGQSVGQQGK
ncbi:cellulose binding domain-containing protein, partial [Waterburya agarophytonicola K14]